MRYRNAMVNNPSQSGLLFSKPWSERPWWSKAKDIISVSITGVILLIVVWEVVRRWLGY